MKAVKLTATDVCEVSGYTRNQLRGVLNELPLYAEQEAEARVARTYQRIDLIVMRVVHVLDTQFGMRRPAIARVIDQVREVLSSPRPINRDARLLITLDPPIVRYLTKQEIIQGGILVALGPVFERVDSYLSANAPSDNQTQELGFGPSLVASKMSGRR